MRKSLRKIALIGMSAVSLAAVAPSFVVLAQEETTVAEESSAEESKEEASSESESVAEETTVAEEAASDEAASGEEQAAAGVTLKLVYAAPVDERSVAQVLVAVQGDKIVDVLISEFQFMQGEGWTPVPSVDGKLGESINEGLTLVQKGQNADAYSKLMKEHANSTIPYVENKEAIRTFVKGKTVKELEDAIAKLDGMGENGKVSDVISGSTLVSSSNYLKAIVQAVNEGIEFPGMDKVESTDLTIKQSLSAPHDDRAFAIVSVVMDGDKVAAASIDELQIVTGDNWKGLPNKDGEWGKGPVEGAQVVSKLVDTDAYSALMKEKAGATLPYIDQLKAVSAFATGKTVDELKAAIKELEGLGEDGKVADIVSGATLQSTPEYLNAIVETAQQ